MDRLRLIAAAVPLVMTGAALTVAAPARADICPYPGVGIGVNVLFGRGGHCDYPTESGGQHLHCETGGFSLGGGLGLAPGLVDGGLGSLALGGSGISGASCTFRCPDGTLAPAPNPPGAWKEYLVPAPTAFCVVNNHMTPNGFWSEPVRPEEGIPPGGEPVESPLHLDGEPQPPGPPP